ncbi:MAG: polymer-forming cytoskeletal protein [Treponema sp.]|nr:polymer-forming cytoskeletal protein [Treponema sp.]
MFETKDTDIVDLEDDDFDTILADDIKFKGNIKFTKPFMIRGTVTGKISATSDLVVDSGAVVTADISASRVLVKGRVEGNIVAERIVRVSSSGCVVGDVTSEQVVLEPGSKFSGRCTMTIPQSN